MKESINVDTKLSKTAAAVTTALELDWDGVKPDQLREWARRTVVINYQRVMRDAGKIPTKDSVKVAEFMEGKGRPERVITPEKILATTEKMDAKALDDLIAKLQAAKKAKK